MRVGLDCAFFLGMNACGQILVSAAPALFAAGFRAQVQVKPFTDGGQKAVGAGRAEIKLKK
jgi:hypothetical protein